MFFSKRKTILGIAVIIFLSSACLKDADINLIHWEYRNNSIPCIPTTSSRTLDDKHELTFNKDHIFCVDIQMGRSDFEIMRNESRFGPSVKEQGGALTQRAAFEYLNQCDVPFPSYYKWYKVKYLNIDGIINRNVGIRKKGFLGSIFSDAPSIKLDLTKYDASNIIGATQTIVLNNNSEDPSRVIQCLFYKLLEWANYPAPRCNLANVSINSEPLGIYSHVEAIDEAFLYRNFGNSSGDLYECQLTDFRASWLSRWESKTKGTDRSKYRIAKIAQILSKTPTNALLSKLNKYLNVQKFIKFWALEILMNHTDGYARNSNNTYVYFDPNDNNRAVFIPSGINYYNADEPTELDEFTTAELPRRLSRCPEAVQMFQDEMNHLLDNVWNENALKQLVDHFKEQVKTGEVLGYDNREGHMESLKAWISFRKQDLKHSLMGGMPRGESKPSSICHFEYD